MVPNIEYVLTEASFEQLEKLLEAEGIILKPVSRESLETVDTSESLTTTNGLLIFDEKEFPYTLKSSTRQSKGARRGLSVRAFEAGLEKGDRLIAVLDQVFPQPPQPTRVSEPRAVRRLEWGTIVFRLGCLGFLGLIGMVIFLAVVGARTLLGW